MQTVKPLPIIRTIGLNLKDTRFRVLVDRAGLTLQVLSPSAEALDNLTAEQRGELAGLIADFGVEHPIVGDFVLDHAGDAHPTFNELTCAAAGEKLDPLRGHVRIALQGTVRFTVDTPRGTIHCTARLVSAGRKGVYVANLKGPQSFVSWENLCENNKPLCFVV